MRACAGFAMKMRDQEIIMWEHAILNEYAYAGFRFTLRILRIKLCSLRSFQLTFSPVAGFNLHRHIPQLIHARTHTHTHTHTTTSMVHSTHLLDLIGTPLAVAVAAIALAHLPMNGALLLHDIRAHRIAHLRHGPAR